MMKRIVLSLFVLLALGSAADAAVCPVGSLQIKDNAAVTASVVYVDDGGGAGLCLPSINIKTWAGGVLGAMANYGTSPGAVLVPGVNASVTASALPTGAATSANQSTEITSLASIASNTGAAIPAGTNNIGNVGLAAGATGGCTPTHYLSAASTNSTNVKNAAGTLCSITIINNTTTAADLRIYNTSSAPTCSSATGVVANYGIQANTTSPGLSPNLGPFGLALGTGISFCLTAYDGTDTNNSNSVTGIQINLGYN
jgi:hypothetical protein